MTDFMKSARKRGLVPDWVWYQINGKSVQENWTEQREKMKEKKEMMNAKLSPSLPQPPRINTTVDEEIFE